MPTQTQSQKITPLITSNSLPFRTAYGPKHIITLDCAPGFGRTKQSFAAEVNINNIMARYVKTGTLDFARKHEPRYGDVTGADFQTAMNTIATANSMFADMPAKVRARFENDPAKFLDFVQNPDNQEEAAELGLTVPKAPEQAAILVRMEAAAAQDPAQATPLAPQAQEQRHGRQSGRQAHQRSRDNRGEEPVKGDPDHYPT